LKEFANQSPWHCWLISQGSALTRATWAGIDERLRRSVSFSVPRPGLKIASGERLRGLGASPLPRPLSACEEGQSRTRLDALVTRKSPPRVCAEPGEALVG